MRPFNIYGPRQTGEGCISNFCTNLLAGKPIEIYGDGKDIRAWCYVSDVVEAVRRILDTPASAGKTFNIGNPNQAPTTAELARLLLRIHGGGEIRHVPTSHNSIPIRIPDITLARTVLGFEPRVDLEEGLSRTLHWFREVQR